MMDQGYQEENLPWDQRRGYRQEQLPCDQRHGYREEELQLAWDGNQECLEQELGLLKHEKSLS